MFNNISLFQEFKNYALQDSIALLQALLKAQEIYLQNYNIDLTSVLSTSSLSLKIFRSKFLNVEIPILKGSVDKFIRQSYFGGGTDYYKAYGENLKIYDINSLYPWNMCKPMPFEIIKEYKDMNLELTEDSDLFGFFETECIIPKSDRPVLPFKHNGKTIHLYGNWKGVYFTEEMKALLKHGYKFKLFRGYEFSKINLFNKYVSHFYNIKNNSSGAVKFIAKMHLNQLYGVFGRRQDTLETINVYNDQIPKYLASRVVKTIIEINDEKSCLLLISNVDSYILAQLNCELETNLSNKFIDVKSNVALASIVTSYSRIHMLSFKFSDHCYYTDSAYINKPLSDYLVSNTELGKFKLESICNKGIFLAPKVYALNTLDNKTIIKVKGLTLII